MDALKEDLYVKRCKPGPDIPNVNVKQNALPRKKSGDSSQDVVSEDISQDSLEGMYANAALVGMRNYGANCYINAGLQCLLCVPELNGYFCEDRFERIGFETKRKRRVVCAEVANFWKEACSGKRDIVSPKCFIAMCPSGQQDAHEFFWKKLFPPIQEETDPANKAEMKDGWGSDEAWKWYRKYHTNILDRLFGGQYKSSVTCKSCRFISVTYEIFLGISLPAMGKTLTECLDEQFESEELSKSVGYKCLKCRNISAATKMMEVDKLPKYLILHFKRLIGGSKKLSKFIQYPRNIDLGKYCMNKKKRASYELVAVCIHNGGPYSGHFYSVGKRGKSVSSLFDLHNELLVALV